MADTYNIEVTACCHQWTSVLTTTGFVEAIAKVIDERRAGKEVRMTVA